MSDQLPSNKPHHRPLRVAQIGAGIFATSAHAPVLRKHPEIFCCVGVWARSLSSAETLADTYEASTTDHSVTAYGGPDGWKELLQRTDLDAVILALPFHVQPAYVFEALQAGKHVLSEKAIDVSVPKAKALVERYRNMNSNNNSSYLHWSIAENYRYEPAILQAARAIQQDIGDPFLATLTFRSPCTADNKYLQTAWRSDSVQHYDGGFLLDSFIHAVALLRATLTGEPVQVSATTSSRAPHIPDVDTLTAQVQWGTSATTTASSGGDDMIQVALAVTYASQKLKMEYEVVGTEGTVLLERKPDGPGYRLTVVNRNNQQEPTVLEFGFGGIEDEFLAFAAACQTNSDGNSKDDEKHKIDCNTPEEATKDLALVEACLVSGKNNGAATKVEAMPW